MPKVNIDDLVEKMLENSDKYPELKVYATGLKELYRQSVESEKNSKTLTKKASEPKISKLEVQEHAVTLKDVMAELGVGV